MGLCQRGDPCGTGSVVPQRRTGGDSISYWMLALEKFGPAAQNLVAKLRNFFPGRLSVAEEAE